MAVLAIIAQKVIVITTRRSYLVIVLLYPITHFVKSTVKLRSCKVLQLLVPNLDIVGRGSINVLRGRMLYSGVGG